MPVKPMQFQSNDLVTLNRALPVLYSNSIIEDDSWLCAGSDGKLGGDPARLQEELNEGERYKPLLRSK